MGLWEGLEQSGRVLETPNLDTAKLGQKWRNLDFRPGWGGGRGLLCNGEILRQDFVVKCSCLFCTYFTHKKFATDPPPQISPRFCPKKSGLSRRISWEVWGNESREFHHLQKQGGGCGIHRVRGGWALVQDHSQKPRSRAHGSCIGSVDIFSEDAWAAWSAIDGH